MSADAWDLFAGFAGRWGQTRGGQHFRLRCVNHIGHIIQRFRFTKEWA
jgi:hypothetical protein